MQSIGGENNLKRMISTQKMALLKIHKVLLVWNSSCVCVKTTACLKNHPLFERPYVKRFALCYLTVVCLCCLSVKLVYCDQTVGWIRMPLSMEVGLGAGNNVLDGSSSPERGTAAPAFFGPCQQSFRIFVTFWATYAIWPLSVCLSSLPVLSVTLVYCGQTFGWIKMPLVMEVGLGWLIDIRLIVKAVSTLSLHCLELQFSDGRWHVQENAQEKRRSSSNKIKI